MTKLGAALILAVAIAAGGTAASGATHVLVPGCGGTDKAAFEPATVIIACGDGNLRLVKLKWSAWSKKSASGKGIAQANTCKPNCAAGKFKSYTVDVSLDKAKTCKNGKREFTRLTYTFPHRRPSGAKATNTVSRPCSG